MNLELIGKRLKKKKYLKEITLIYFMGNLEIKLIYWLEICIFLTKKKDLIDIFQLPFLVEF